MDFDIRSLGVVEDSTLEHARLEATGNLNILNSALNAHVKTTGKCSIINSTMTRNHVLYFHGDQCHKRMESSVVGPCHGYCIEVYNLTNSSVKLHGSSMQTATRLYQSAAWNMEARELEALHGMRPSAPRDLGIFGVLRSPYCTRATMWLGHRTRMSSSTSRSLPEEVPDSEAFAAEAIVKRLA